MAPPMATAQSRALIDAVCLGSPRQESSMFVFRRKLRFGARISLGRRENVALMSTYMDSGLPGCRFKCPSLEPREVLLMMCGLRRP